MSPPRNPSTASNADSGVDFPPSSSKYFSSEYSPLDIAIQENAIRAIRSPHETEPKESKVKIAIGLLKNFIGVKDLASVRMSLPSQLLEPIGNLEYWTYLDRPDFAAIIGDSDDPLERMLATIRFNFSKDLKFVKGRLFKPYNSILGEQFHCTWEVPSAQLDSSTGEYIKLAHVSDQSLSYSEAEEATAPRHNFTCIIEQTSHHPPVSGYAYWCEEKGILVHGIDQIATQFVVTAGTVRVGAGEHNKGLFIRLTKRDEEEYHCTHPIGYVHGWFKSSLYITMGDTVVISCAKTGLKAIVEYKEERLFGKPKFLVEGLVFRYDPSNETEVNIRKLKQVPDDRVVATIDGSWHEKVWVTTCDGDRRLLVDLSILYPVPKIVRPIEEQGHLESRRVWKEVTSHIFAREYNLATQAKVMLEERQRKKAAELKERNEVHQPLFFQLPFRDGRVELTAAGKEVLFNGKSPAQI
ncbi:uncharacterized protein VTP21DRAFT_466 [Calcarisporiella thermophila]|uniref:uncharacterized protein n=1 Tax=Calcarisporiella thermophila TaxID=911321 RepID=UPI0037426D77